MQSKYDMLWKGMLEEVVDDMLLFVEPGIVHELDFERDFEFLDKELEEMYPDAEKPGGVRVVDKLLKIFLTGGGERWMLLHIEVQNTIGANFAERMFQYYYRLVDRYGKPVAAIAVFTGRNAKKMPDAFEEQFLWMRVRYEYKCIRISDYSEELLVASINPVAILIMVTQIVLLRMKYDEDEWDEVLLEKKIRIAQLIKDNMDIYGERKTNALLIFLNNYQTFKNPEIKLKFMEKTDEIFGKKNTMGILEQLAEIKHQEGIEEGLLEGRAQERKNSNRRFVETLLKKSKFDNQKIAELVGVSVAFVKGVKTRLGGN